MSASGRSAPFSYFSHAHRHNNGTGACGVRPEAPGSALSRLCRDEGHRHRPGSAQAGAFACTLGCLLARVAVVRGPPPFTPLHSPLIPSRFIGPAPLLRGAVARGAGVRASGHDLGGHGGRQRLSGGETAMVG